ncbi:hypothetical protein BDK51DRAFT_39323 [Blyttiomyces helicus]|uniref:SET domain-containing protein n=1 Tax=Blyttiomyces helicus TaxID=388810 RepID=A0A4P9WFT5_9FUNG|nr:hypothetical protein BDK51DRAFT_39323 [Blyttiomyces helicus]|eukprot:RKO91651.1 hypothetical protein BDK51DRAFT_39323 [Blyttiomyces helicus]
MANESSQISTTSSQALSNFLAWLASHNCPTPGLNLQWTPERGVGVYAAQDLDLIDDAPVARIPSDLLLGASKVRALANGRSQPARRLRACLDAIALDPEIVLDERLTIVVFLIWARFCEGGAEGNVDEGVEEGGDVIPATFWQPYVKILPGSVTTPLFFPAAARVLLCGTGLDVAAGSKARKLHGEHARLEAHLRLLEPPTETTTPPLVGLVELRWADGVYWSRVISFRSSASFADPAAPAATDADDCHLVPFVDFCNHSCSPRLRWHMPDAGGCIELRAVGDGPVAAGEEMFISYGAKPNAELLFMHGFVMPANANDYVAFPAPFLEAQVEGDEEDGEDEVEEEGATPAEREEREARRRRRGAALLAIKDKLTFLSALSLRPMVEIHAPRPNDPLLADDPSRGILDDSSLLVMFAAVLTAEDGFGRTDNGSAEVPEFGLGGEPIYPLTPDTFRRLVDALPHREIVLLRVWSVLLELAGYRLYELASSEGPNTGDDGEGGDDGPEEAADGVDNPDATAKGESSAKEAGPESGADLEEKEESPEVRQVRAFRKIQFNLLAAASEELGSLQESYAQLPVVVAYLNAASEVVDAVQ